MDFTLNNEQRLIVDTSTSIGNDFGLDYWRACDGEKRFPREFWLAVCDAGLSGVALPEEVGGAGLGAFEMVLVIEALAAGGGGATVGQLFMNNAIFGGVAISSFGSAEMKEELLPALMAGDLNFCMALTEPNAGSNSLGLESFAEETGNGWVLSGQKTWITGVGEAGKMLVIARTKKASEVMRRTEGLSMFLIDVDREGLTHTPIEKLGTNTLSSSAVFFDNVKIHAHELVGTLNGGWKELLDILNTERLVTTAGLVGAGRLALRLAVEYANDRKVFGSTPISKYQGLQFPLAQCWADVEAASLLNYRAASNYDAGLPFGSEANAAKLLAAQVAARATEQAMQTMGGMGYSKEYHVERLWRDCRLFRFAPVSEEMILNYIAMHDLGMPRSY